MEGGSKFVVKKIFLGGRRVGGQEIKERSKKKNGEK